MRVMRTPALAMALLGAGCFAESSVYDDCERVDCTGSSGDDGSTTTPASTTAITTTTTATTSATSTTESLDSSDAESSTPTTETSNDASSSDGESSSDEATPARCGDGMLEPPEECEDADDGDPHDGCNACVITPQLVWTHERDYGDDALDDAALALAADGDQVQVSAVIGNDVAFDDAYWFRLDTDNGFVDPEWGYMASLAENNRVLALARTGNDCALGGFVNGWGGASVAAGNTLDCDTGLITGDLQIGEAQVDGGPDSIRALVVRGDGGIVVGGVRMFAGAPRGWIAELAPGGQTLLSTTWLDDPILYGTSSEVNALALAPDDSVFVAGSFDDGSGPRGFAAPLDLATSMPAPFALTENESVAIDVRPIATGMAVAGWSISAGGDADARVELFDMDGGAPAVWTLGNADEDRLHGLDVTPDGVVATGFTRAPATGDDVLVVWLDDGLAEQHRAVWNSSDAGDDVAWDVLSTPDGVTIGGTAQGVASHELLVQRWVIP